MKKPNTVGIDMGDKMHRICVLDDAGDIIDKENLDNTCSAITARFEGIAPCLIALETGTYSRWVSSLLEDLGHEVLVGNARKLRAIWDGDDKTDDRDAEMLARIARLDPKLLHPVHHRGEEAHSVLAIIKARDMLVKSRTKLVAHVRGSVKAAGSRITVCAASSFHGKAIDNIPENLIDAMLPVIKIIEEITLKIRNYDMKIKDLCKQQYPETEKILSIRGVGPVTALAYVLTIEESSRFKKSRTAGAFLGLTTKRDQSGQTDKQLHITKAGNVYLRRLLVGCAQHIMGPFGADSDLRRFGEKLSQRGGKNAKRRAVVAVARKLAVLIHHIWVSGEKYDPFYQTNRKQKKAA